MDIVRFAIIMLSIMQFSSGRFQIKLFPTFIHHHGKTHDYKIPTSSVIRLFLLPHKDQRQMFFCVNVDPPIKQARSPRIIETCDINAFLVSLRLLWFSIFTFVCPTGPDEVPLSCVQLHAGRLCRHWASFHRGGAAGEVRRCQLLI